MRLGGSPWCASLRGILGLGEVNEWHERHPGDVIARLGAKIGPVLPDVFAPAPRSSFPVLNTPVILSVFDRPESTRRVFGAIAQAKPKQLFVFADGPRSDADVDRCAQARTVVENVDWACDVKYRYSETNLGARECYTSGVDWALSEVDEGIVLDDDCVPDPTFFMFSQDMLERYRHDPRVMMVCGTNYLGHWKEDRQSYHFSHFGSVWGWATWKRAWALYDAASMSAWGDESVDKDDTATFSPTMRSSRSRLGDSIVSMASLKIATSGIFHGAWHRGPAHSGLTIVPSVNLVANIGNIDGHGLPRTIPCGTWRSRHSHFRCDPRVRSPSTESTTSSTLDGSSNGLRSNQRTTPRLAVVL